MSDNIPPVLIGEILSRLPAAHLHELRRVCKAWRDVIEDPAFIRSHLHLQLGNSLSGQLVLRADGINSLVSVPVGSLLITTNSDESKIKATPLHPNTNPFNDLFAQGGEGGEYQMASCNGVMLMSCVVGNTISSILWNPSTGESLELPKHTSAIPSADQENIYMNAGFGYDYTHDDYKVVNIMQSRYHIDNSIELEAMVYSMKSDSWRQSKDFPYFTALFTPGAFLNGALHWVGATRPSMLDLIVGIDLATEDHFEMRMPQEIMTSDNNQIKDCSRRLNVLDGCISLICFYRDSALELWLMKDYRVERSWNKLFSIAKWDYMPYEPITYSKSRGIVVLRYRRPEYICLDLDNISSPKKVTVDGCAPFYAQESTFHLETLVRLNTTAKGRIRRRKRDEEATSSAIRI